MINIMLKMRSGIAPSLFKKLHFLFIFCLLINFSASYAEGSKDLYPSGAKGNRAFLYCNTSTDASESWPFKTPGTHYIYVKAGEVIAAGSSAQGYSNGIIRFIAPNGDIFTSTRGERTVGRIKTRTEELAGAKIGSTGNPTGYTPFEMDVPAGGEGVWKVEFISPLGTGDSDTDVPDILADASVRKKTATEWLSGRLFANVLNLHLRANFLEERSYFAKHYVLTKDGRAYRVQTNGSNGVGFTFFSNSNGFAKNSVPTYKSLNKSAYADILEYTHNPTSPDQGTNVTHKIFYNKPNPDLPAKAFIAGSTGQETWLKNQAELPKISNLMVIGVEGTTGIAGRNGAYIKFKSSAAGTYRITIPVSTPSGPADRVIIGLAKEGDNTVLWDGKDGNGAFLKEGTLISKLKTKLLSAEVHFPYIDMEVNPLGLIIELTDNTTDYNLLDQSKDESVYSDRIYWDDSDVTGAGVYDESSNPFYNAINGLSSKENGHKWGRYKPTGGSGNSGTGLNSFGNVKSMDTWAYIQGSEEDTPVDLTIKVADLKVESIVPDVTTLLSNRQITYTIRVKNSGPSSVTGSIFAFKAPPGFEITGESYTVVSEVGVVRNIQKTAGDFNAVLDMNNDAVIEFKIIVKSSSSSLTYPLAVEASILRPADVTDPDATNPILNPDPNHIQPPSDPHLECLNGTLNESCNNIKYNGVIVQELCAGAELTPIEFIAANGGQVEVIGTLPAGLSTVFSSGNTVLKITGIPQTSGVFTLGTLGNERERNTYLIRINPIPELVVPLDKINACEGKNISVAVSSTTEGNTFQWQYFDNSTSAWTDFVAGGSISGENTSTLNIASVPLSFSNTKLRVLATSSAGCVGTSSEITLIVNKLPDKAVVTPSKPAFCVGFSVKLVSSVAHGNQWYKDNQILEGKTEQSYEASEEGEYYVIITNDQGCESEPSAKRKVTVYPIQPTPVIKIEGGTSTCVGTPVKLTSDALTGNQWYKDNDIIEGEEGPTYWVTETGKYRVMVTNENKCEKLSDEISITVNPIPEKPTISASTSTEFCFGGSVLLTSSAATGNQWYKDEELIQGATNPTYLADASGKYKVIVTLDGCSSPASLETEVKVNPIPEKPTITANTSTEFCFGGSVLLTSSAATGNQWYKDEELIQGATNPTYLADASGKYKVVVTLNSCVSPASLDTEVKVNPIPEKPTITASTSTEFCFGGSVLLTSSAATGNQWYKDEELIQGATNPTYLADASGKYKVIVTLAGCSSPASLETEVKVNPIPEKPTITASTSTEFCFGGSVLLTSSVATGNQWYKDEELIQGATNPTYLADASGKYKVIVTLIGCSSPASLETEVKVNPIPEKPTITASTSTESCFGGSVLLTSSAATGNQWYKDEELIQGATNPTYLADSKGKYKVVVTLIGCSSPASLDTEVKVNPILEKPTITANTSTEFCFGGSVLLTSSAATGNQWYKDEELIQGATNPTYLADASGKYKVIVTLAGCSSPASLDTKVKVNPIPEKPTITVSTSTEFCFGGSVLLTSSALNGNQWYKDEELIQGATNPTYLADASGKYKVVVTLIGCSSPASLDTEVKVNPIPEKPTITASTSTEFCFGGSVLLTSSAATGNQWYKDGNLIPGATNPTYLANTSGKYKVIVTLNTCSSPASLETEVTVNPIPETPTITASTSTEFCFGGSVLLTSSSITGNQWYKDGNLIPGATNPTYLANTSGKYKVIVTLNTCSSPASLETEVTVNPIPQTPQISASGPTTFCIGGSVTLNSSQTHGNQWYKDGTLIQGAVDQTYTTRESGKYTLSFTDKGCVSPVSASLTVTVNPLPQIPVITASTQTSFCEGGSVLLTSSATTGNQWYKDNILIPGATAKTYTASTSGIYTVAVTNTNGCISPGSLPLTVTENPYPVTPGISPSNTTTFCEGGVVTLTSSSASGNQWYKNGTLIPNAIHQTYEVNEIGVYTVKVTSTSGCTSASSTATTVTVTPVPRGFDDELNTLSCTQSSFTYHLQTGNINNTVKRGNAVPSSFTWTVNSPLTGARNGSGNSINATLINTGTSPQEVIYTVTPRALNGGCIGTPFKIKVHVPVCLGISITKTADRNLVSSVGDRINYTITVKNTGNANHHQVLVNDALTGGRLHNPTGDNGNGILEKDESWIYTTSYILSQSDFDNNGVPLANLGKVQNIATVQSTESPSPAQASAEVAIRQNPIIRLVKTGVFNNDLKTITYTFRITNKGNVTLRNLELKDPKIPGLLVSNATILAPGAAATLTANYTITEPEKKIGNVRNTATATGEYSPGNRVADISGTNANNDDPTDVDVIRYPQAIDDFATTKADVEVVVRVAANDRASLFPLDVSTIEVKTQPANGGLQLNKDGRVVYHPNKGYSGIERFTYKINDANGLHSNTAVVTVNVVPPDLDIPNTFTPNGDGRNDTFQIKGRENYDSIEISIFNRWGDEVYKNKNYKDEWSGEGLNEGTYFYVIKLKKGGNEESRRSWVLIKR